MGEFLEDPCAEFFKYYPELGSINTQLTWLRAMVPGNMDPVLYPCIANRHRLSETAYNDIVGNYWGSAAPVYTKIDLNDIKDAYATKDINYDSYMRFMADEESVITYVVVSEFKLEHSCYSLPFMEALYSAYGKGAVLLCTLGIHEGRETVLFYVEDVADSYYDFSQIPP